MESTRYFFLYTTSWLPRYATFLGPQTLALYMEVSDNSQNQWVEKLVIRFILSFSDCLLNGYIVNRIIPHCERIGSTSTDRQSNSKCYLEWVDYYRPIPRDLRLINFKQRRLVLWPPISKQPITCFSIIMTIRKLKCTGMFLVTSLEVVRFAVWIGGIPWWRY